MAFDLAKLHCPECGQTFLEYRRTGLLGCPNDYAAFAPGLLSLLVKSWQQPPHAGKRPRRQADGVNRGREARALRRQIREAIAQENYEEASRLRALLLGKETADDH